LAEKSRTINQSEINLREKSKDYYEMNSAIYLPKLKLIKSLQNNQNSMNYGKKNSIKANSEKRINYN